MAKKINKNVGEQKEQLKQLTQEGQSQQPEQPTQEVQSQQPEQPTQEGQTQQPEQPTQEVQSQQPEQPTQEGQTQKSEKLTQTKQPKPPEYKIECCNRINESFGGVSFQNGVAYTKNSFTASWFRNKEGYTVSEVQKE